MGKRFHNSVQSGIGWQALTMLLSLMLAMSAASAFGQQKKNAEPAAATPSLVGIDIKKVVWPQPPNIARIKYLDYFAGEKLPDFTPKAKKKSGWMDRVAGINSNQDDVSAALRNHYFLGEPHGMAVDSKGKLFVADGKVSAIFIFDPETHETKMIKNGKDASFKLIMGLAMDDNDRLFVADSGARHILVFNAEHHPEAVISEGLSNPVGLAIDTENRFLYVADVNLD